VTTRSIVTCPAAVPTAGATVAAELGTKEFRHSDHLSSKDEVLANRARTNPASIRDQPLAMRVQCPDGALSSSPDEEDRRLKLEINLGWQTGPCVIAEVSVD
jgi:hypothetical protein